MIEVTGIVSFIEQFGGVYLGLGHGKPWKQNLVVDLGIRGPLGKAKWLSEADMGGNMTTG